MPTTADVYVGVWRNWGANGMLTLTLKERDAVILESALLTFLGFVAAQAWNLTKYILHQARAGRRDDGVDGYFSAQQAALRNGAGHVDASWTLFRLGFAWRRALGWGAVLRRSQLLLAVSITSMMMWSTARLFLPLLWTLAGEQFLLASSNCGTLYPNLSLTSDSAQVWNVYYKDRFESSSAYERQCYSAQPLGPSDCSRFPVSQLNWTSSDAQCPFADQDLCFKTNSVPIRMDSGYISSNTHLGVNAPHADIIEYRKVATCSPLLSNYADAVTALDPRDTVFRYYYGYNAANQSEVTFEYWANYLTLIDGYRLTTFSYDPASNGTAWRPNTTTMFNRDDADMSIFFLMTDSLLYLTPVSDPWFHTDPDLADVESFRYKDETVTLYPPLRPVSVLGCVEEHELCNPSRSTCTPFTLAADIDALSSHLQLNPRQAGTASRLLVSLLPTDLSNVAFMLDRPILASKTILGGTQYARLPPDQWRLEVGRWFAVSLALLQASVVEFVTGPADPALAAYVLQASSPDLLADCRLQRARNVPGWRNLDLLGVVVLVAVGLGIVLMGLSIEGVVGWAQTRLRRGETRKRSWALDGAFQLQRLALEAAGVHGWEDLDSSMPWTRERVGSLGDASAAQKAHPALLLT